MKREEKEREGEREGVYIYIYICVCVFVCVCSRLLVCMRTRILGVGLPLTRDLSQGMKQRCTKTKIRKKEIDKKEVEGRHMLACGRGKERKREKRRNNWERRVHTAVLVERRGAALLSLDALASLLSGSGRNLNTSRNKLIFFSFFIILLFFFCREEKFVEK